MSQDMCSFGIVDIQWTHQHMNCTSVIFSETTFIPVSPLTVTRQQGTTLTRKRHTSEKRPLLSSIAKSLTTTYSTTDQTYAASAESQVSTQVRTVSTAMSNSLSVSTDQSFTEDKTDHSTTFAVTALHFTLVKSQPTITPTSVSYGTPDSDTVLIIIVITGGFVILSVIIIIIVIIIRRRNRRSRSLDFEMSPIGSSTPFCSSNVSAISYTSSESTGSQVPNPEGRTITIYTPPSSPASLSEEHPAARAPPRSPITTRSVARKKMTL